MWFEDILDLIDDYDDDPCEGLCVHTNRVRLLRDNKRPGRDMRGLP
jgi:hypothetical protein